MSWWQKHDRPIPRPDLIRWTHGPHGWTGSTFGPKAPDAIVEQVDRTVRPAPDQPSAHRLQTDPKPTAPIDPWREAKQHFGRLIAEAKK